MAIKGLELAVACAKAAEELKAEDIRILDVRKVSSITDYLVVCTGTSMPQLRAILRDVSGKVVEASGVRPVHSEGRADTRWVVLDYIDVMVHVMDPEVRGLYGIEALWKDAPEIGWRAIDVPKSA